MSREGAQILHSVNDKWAKKLKHAAGIDNATFDDRSDEKIYQSKAQSVEEVKNSVFYVQKIYLYFQKIMQPNFYFSINTNYILILKL